MSEIGVAVGAILLILFFVRWHRGSLATPRRLGAEEQVTMEAMTEMVAELTPSLRETAMVTAPQSLPDRGHVWASPCGKRVYIN